MRKEYKAHPLMILDLVKPFLFVLLFPLFKAFIQYITLGEVIGIMNLEIAAFLVIIIIGTARWICFRLICDENYVIIKTGFFFAKKAKIPLSRLSSVQSTQNPLDAIFGAVTYSINTEAGVRNRSDFKFKLTVKNSKEVSRLLYEEEENSKVHFSVFKVAIMAATTSSAVTGILVGVPVINRIGDLLGVALSKMLLDEINNVSSKVENYFPPIVNTVSLIILLAYIISFLYLFFKYINFKLYLSDNKLEVKSGFFVRRRTSFAKKSVINVKIEQTALMKLFKRYEMKVSVGGFGETRGESQVIVPSGKRREIKKGFSLYFPFLAPQGNVMRARRNKITQGRFLFWPAVYLLVVLTLSAILVNTFLDFGRLILFLTIVALCVIFYYAYICIYEYKSGKVRLGKNIFARSTRGLRTYELYCPRENVGEIKLTRYLTDPYYKTCRLTITVCSESADSIRVRHLDYETVKREVYKCYNIYEYTA